MNYKTLTTTTYNIHASHYEQEKGEYTQKYLTDDVHLFLNHLKGKRVIDIGAGPGRDAQIFKDKGFEPYCIDTSISMVNLCTKKGLLAEVIDLEDLRLVFSANSFEGAWAYTSLLHIPKTNIPRTLHSIQHIIIPQGILYLGMKEGSFEGFKQYKTTTEKRYFTFYTSTELRNLLNPCFEILHESKVVLGPEHTYLNFLCQSRKEQ